MLQVAAPPPAAHICRLTAALCSSPSKAEDSCASTSSPGPSPNAPAHRPVAKALAISPDGRFYAIGRQDGTIDEYDARSLQLVRHHALDNPVQTLVFSPDSRELAVEDTSNVVRIWDTCAVCENPSRLAQLAAQESVRQLTQSERATFGIGQ